MRFLFLDRILEIEPGRRILASKLVTMADGYLVNHYADRPVMPPSILLECLAQVGGDLNLLTRGIEVQTFLIMADGLRVRRLPSPGETILIEVVMDRGQSAGATVRGEVRIGDEVIATLDRMVYVHRVSDDTSYHRRQRRRMETLLATKELPVPSNPTTERPRSLTAAVEATP
jgi:3-hydroxyacyl-[acyl-carrier-protein] dehydratase